MTKSKTIVTVVCTMLICLLMISFCVSLFGCSLDRNADYFDMKNFVGEYENATISPEDDVVTINICTGTPESINIIMTVYCKIVNGDLVLTRSGKKNSEDRIVKTETLDANVVAMILHYTEIFSGNCVVTDTEFKFLATGTTMKIGLNEYVGAQRFPTDVVPVRLVDIYDESKQVTLALRLNTTYYSRDEGVVVEDSTSFSFERDYIPVEGNDGITYKLQISHLWYIKQK
uniref:hypothetical protein n=1 Tax=Candidatus Fimenecus sp. TaxID=3022888 RepID=UPI004026F1FA